MATEPFLGEIQIFGCNFSPRGYAFCNGQLLSIAQNTALFSLLGTNFGGDGRTTFGLPDFQGRAAINDGTGPGLQNYRVGEKGGSPTVTLNTNQIPSHNHLVNSYNDAGANPGPGGNVLAASGTDSRGNMLYASDGPAVSMNNAQIQNTGGNQPHNNMSPYMVLNYCIALEGLFPSRN